MPYPKNLLNDGEELVLDLRPHWMYVVPTIVVAVAVTIGMLVLWAMTGWGWMGIATLVVGLALGVNVAQRWAKWTTTSFTITTDRVIFRQGLVSKNGVEIPLERVMNVNFNQSIWERMIGAGDLLIESGGRDGQSRFSDVRKPELVAKELHNQTNRYTREPRAVIPQSGSDLPPPPPTPAADHADQLAKLHDLLTRGAITQAEYDTKKAELLNRL